MSDGITNENPQPTGDIGGGHDQTNLGCSRVERNHTTISNAAFLSAIFGPFGWQNSHVTAFSCPPEQSTVVSWAGGYAKASTVLENAALNQYFTVSLFNPDGSGLSRRRKADFAAQYCTVLDDLGSGIGAKINPLVANDKPPFSWILETSRGNYQCGYLFRDPVSDADLLSRFNDALIYQGMCSGTDPGQRGTTRYMRLPNGVNNKSKYGEPFQCKLVTWNPERQYTIDELIQGWGLVLSEPESTQATRTDYIPGTDEIENILVAAGLFGPDQGDGYLQCPCPNESSHTLDDGRTGYKPGTGFKCFHGNCDAIGSRELMDWLQENHSDEVALEWFGHPQMLPEEVQRVAVVPITRFTDALVNSHKSGRNIAMEFAGQDCIQSKHLITYQGVVYEYKNGAYKSTEKDWLKHQITNFIPHCFSVDDKGNSLWAEPTRVLVNNAMGVVHAASHDARFDEALPLWRSDHEGYPEDTSSLILFRNGMLDIKTKKFYPSTPALFTLNPLPFDYEPDAPIPERFFQFLNEVWELLPGEFTKPEHLLLQEIFGYLLSGETSMQKIFMLIGLTRSGKGTIGRLMKTLVGKPAFCGASLRASSSHFGLEGLIDKRLWLVADARITKKDDQGAIVERLLNISGEDPVSVPRKHIGDWTGILSARTVILSNSIPKLYEPSGAMEARLIPLRFSNSFFGREDKDLDAKLQAEISGIINWAILGLDRLKSAGQFTVTNDVLEMKEDFRELANPMADFVGGVVVEEFGHCEVTSDVFAVWNDYRREHQIPMGETPRSFGRILREVLPNVRKKRNVSYNGRICDLYSGVKIIKPLFYPKTYPKN